MLRPRSPSVLLLMLPFLASATLRAKETPLQAFDLTHSSLLVGGVTVPFALNGEGMAFQLTSIVPSEEGVQEVFNFLESHAGWEQRGSTLVYSYSPSTLQDGYQLQTSCLVVGMLVDALWRLLVTERGDK